MVRTVLLGVAIVVAGCGRAIVMHQTKHGGVIELDGDHSKGMEDANERMAEHCGANNYTIVKEGWERGGADMAATQDTAEDAQAQQVAVKTSDSKWRVRYQCNTATAQAPTAAPAAGPMTAPPPATPQP